MNETVAAFEYEQLVFSQYQSSLVWDALNHLVHSLLIKGLNDGKTILIAKSNEHQEKNYEQSNGNSRKRPREPEDQEIEYRDRSKELYSKMDRLIKEKREQIDQSNRQEFVKISQLLNLSGDTCARTDAIQISRRTQMKYHVVNNEDGPLARSTFHGVEGRDPTRNEDVSESQRRHSRDIKTSSAHVLTMRCQVVEEHLNIQYSPAPPSELHRRLDYIENHIIQLEKEHPPWAAVHFRQPNRQFPPPPPLSVYGVPQSERTTLEKKVKAMMAAAPHKQSSLTRAILGKLQKQQK